MLKKLLKINLILFIVLGVSFKTVSAKITQDLTTNDGLPSIKKVRTYEAMANNNGSYNVYSDVKWEGYIGTQTSGRWYNMEEYEIVGSELDGIGICVSPHKDSRAFFNVKRVIDPTINAKGKNENRSEFEMALVWAYQEFIRTNKIYDNSFKVLAGWANKRNTVQYADALRQRQIIMMVVRWIYMKYGFIDEGGPWTKVDWLEDNQHLVSRGDNKAGWDKNNATVKEAARIAKKAIDVANKFTKYKRQLGTNKKAYQKLVEEGYIWDASKKITNTKPEIEITKDDENRDMMKIRFTLNANSISEVYWDDAKASCESDNNGYWCGTTITNVKGKKADVVITVKALNGQSLTVSKVKKVLTFKIGVNDIYIPASHLWEVEPTVGGFQNFLLIKDVSDDFETIIPYELNIDDDDDDDDDDGGNEPKENEVCTCEMSSGQWTGNFVNTKTITDSNGKVKEEKEVFSPDDTEKVKKYDCPNVSECMPNGGKCQKVNGVYYDKDGNVTTPEIYRQQCVNICVKKEEDNKTVYYCNSSDPDVSGRVCSEEDYNLDCVCEPLRKKCEESSGDNSPECQEYNTKCPNCNATVSVPNACSEFDPENTITGSISDINTVSSECNKVANNVKTCVLGGKDQNNESYAALTELDNKISGGNPYCQVWCKEKYDFDLPTARYTTSGGYFTLSSQISGQRDCYVSSKDNPDKPIDEEKFLADLNTLKEKSYSAWNEWNKWLSLTNTADFTGNNEDSQDKAYTWSAMAYDYNSGTTQSVSYNETVNKSQVKHLIEDSEKIWKSAASDIETAIKNYNSCTTLWTNDMKFEPKILFTYDEDYSKENLLNGELSRVESSLTKKIDNNYCLGDIDSKYNCIGETITSQVDDLSDINANLYKNVKYTSCDSSGCSQKDAKVSNVKWIRKTKIYSATYKPNNNFSTYTQYGTIKVDSELCPNNGDCIYSRLPSDALPVEMTTGKGVFPFTFTFENIGQDNVNGELGRLINGSESSVLTAYNELNDNLKCGLSKEEKLSGITSTANGSYVCHYINNCDDCEIKCEDDNCEIVEECDGPSCPLRCKNCVFDGENTTFSYRTVSQANLFPNDRALGYNWDDLGSAISKAAVTKREIEESTSSGEEKLIASYTITPTNINNMKKYDRNVGTYTNSTDENGNSALKCSNVVINGIEYSVMCRSSFLDDGESKGFFTENARSTEWTLWSDTTNCPNGECLSKEDGVGPSWK